jgi:outer membrane lipoprotein SlyB
MRQDTYRKIGAISGLAVGMFATFALGYGGHIVPSALLGAASCVAGAMLGEQVYARSRP